MHEFSWACVPRQSLFMSLAWENLSSAENSSLQTVFLRENAFHCILWTTFSVTVNMKGQFPNASSNRHVHITTKHSHNTIMVTLDLYYHACVNQVEMLDLPLPCMCMNSASWATSWLISRAISLECRCRGLNTTWVSYFSSTDHFVFLKHECCHVTWGAT